MRRTTGFVLSMLIASGTAKHLAEDEQIWGRMLLEFDSMSMSMPNEWETPWPTPLDTCGNGIIDSEGEECEPPGGKLGGSPFECGPNRFCNDNCHCEFPEGACIDRVGVVPHGHLCIGNPTGPTHSCCNGGKEQGTDNLCNNCWACEHNVAIHAQCCRDIGVTECEEEDVCCPMTAFGRDIMVCLPPELGGHGESCNPSLCSLEDLESGNQLCQSCSNCLQTNAKNSTNVYKERMSRIARPRGWEGN